MWVSKRFHKNCFIAYTSSVKVFTKQHLKIDIKISLSTHFTSPTFITKHTFQSKAPLIHPKIFCWRIQYTVHVMTCKIYICNMLINECHNRYYKIPNSNIQCVKYNVKKITVRKSSTKSTVPNMSNGTASRQTGTKTGNYKTTAVVCVSRCALKGKKYLFRDFPLFIFKIQDGRQK